MKKDIAEKLRNLPAVDSLLNHPDGSSWVARHGRTATVAAIRKVVEDTRRDLLQGKTPPVDDKSILEKAGALIAASSQPILGRVVNATGIILHTGLGRAVMPAAAARALEERTGFCNVQMDLETGERVHREQNIHELVCELTGAEDVLLVNNNAGATLLVLKALAEGKEVVISRGELIEIGGSFRLPEIMEQSGAVLREVGATNKTHLRDYEKAISPDTAMLLKAHKSNYCIVGFTTEVGIDQIATLGKKHGIPVIDDLGCGALVGLETFGMAHEMTLRESLQAGADLVLSSTDKLIGGPQGGLIAGRRDLIQQIRNHPLYRALRVCKLTLAALESTLRLFRSPERLAQDHPLYFMISRSNDDMVRQAEDLARRIAEQQPGWNVSVSQEKSYLGGGTLPGTDLPAPAVRITSPAQSADDISRLFRRALPAVIPHIHEDAVWLNMRTVFPNDSEDIIRACAKP